MDLNKIAPVGKIKTGVRVKIPEIECDGNNYPIGRLFLDLPVVIELKNKIIQKVGIIIETEIDFDGISIRKLDVSKIRNPITKSNYKASQKKATNIKNDIGKNIVNFGIQYGGISYINNLINIIETLFNNSIDGKHKYKGKLFIEEKEIGKSTFIAKKHNGGKGKLPSISTNTNISISNGNAGILSCRLNIPLFGLSRDHAKPIKISVKQKVTILIDDFQVGTKEIDNNFEIGKFKYTTIATSGEKTGDKISYL